MAPHSSALAWKISWTEEPGGLQSMGLPKVRHDWVTSLSLFTLMHWRRKWQPTPVFLPGESQGWGRTESDTTEWLSSSSSRPECWWLEPSERTLRQPDRGRELTKGRSSPVVSKPAQVMEWVPSLSLPNFRSFSWYLSWTKSNGSPRTEGLNIAHPGQVPESQAMCSKEGWGEDT